MFLVKKQGCRVVSNLPKTMHSDNGAGTTPRPSIPGGGRSHATDDQNLLDYDLIVQHYDSHEVDERPLEIPMYLQDKQRGGPWSALSVHQQMDSDLWSSGYCLPQHPAMLAVCHRRG